MKRGFTLIEVLLATMIMSFGLTVLLVGASQCLRTVGAAKYFQHAQLVMGLGEADHPLLATNDVESLAVDGEDYDGFIFSRAVEEDEDEDGLFVVRTRVSWTDARRKGYEEVVRYVLEREK